ncbi:MAG: sigma-70 family RNA polymerase sigma factor [Acidobacteria bacterium]|nr:sigma-70 family RNA polymerase sigma factor [Acidobacteriota bacterium]
MSESRTVTNLFFWGNRKTGSAAKAKKAEVNAELVERYRAGEKDAFNELYKRLSPLVHGIVLSRVPRDEVDDIVQEVFISAFNNIGDLRDSSAVSPWIAQIARNRSVEFFRRNRPSEELPENLTGRRSRKNEANEILAILREMPEAYRETLILRLVEGLTGPEIAEHTGLTHSSVRVNLHRGMRMLRSRLGIEEKSNER